MLQYTKLSHTILHAQAYILYRHSKIYIFNSYFCSLTIFTTRYCVHSMTFALIHSYINNIYTFIPLCLHMYILLTHIIYHIHLYLCIYSSRTRTRWCSSLRAHGVPTDDCKRKNMTYA